MHKKHLFDKKELFKLSFTIEKVFFYGERAKSGTYEMVMQVPYCPHIILVMISPKYAVSLCMSYLKGKCSLMIFDRYSYLKHKFDNRHFWNIGYYVSTVGVNEATIRKYITDQFRPELGKHLETRVSSIFLQGGAIQ